MSVYRTLFIAALLSAALAFPAGASERLAEVERLAAAEQPSLEKLYVDLHSHPELSFQEERTAARLAAELLAAGFEVTKGVGGHGLVGVLANGKGPTLLVRAEMDALPVEEKTGASYASRETAVDDKGRKVSVMHACGHDIHMTALIGAARVLAGTRSKWSGTLVMIGQPAEERGGGAKAMLDDGLFTRFPRPDFALAQHVAADLEAGKIGYSEGARSAAISSVDITVRGVGGHAAYPHSTKDPVVMASQLVLALQTIVSREIDPTEPAVVTVGSIHGGTKRNVIPDEVELKLTVRTYSDDVRDKALAAIKRLARGVALAAGVPEDRAPVVEVRGQGLPAGHNDPALSRRCAAAIGEALGAKNVVYSKATMGGDDFAYYGRTEPRVPTLYWRLGALPSGRSAEGAPSLHSALFLPDRERAIRTGVIAMSVAALDLLGK